MYSETSFLLKSKNSNFETEQGNLDLQYSQKINASTSSITAQPTDKTASIIHEQPDSKGGTGFLDWGEYKIFSVVK